MPSLSKYKKYLIFFLVALILFVIPFFWLKNGEMDLGGDGNRLYFYDPVSYLKFTNLFDVSAYGKGAIEPAYIYIPYIGLLAVLKLFFSPTMLVDFINGIKLSLGFLAVSLIVYELLKNDNVRARQTHIGIAALLGGLFYVMSLGSINMAIFWDRALVTHNQIFLNPLMFYLLMKFFLSRESEYLWVLLFTSFIFAPNFGPAGAPPFFAFYPLAILFLLLYLKACALQPIPWKKAIVGLVLFLGIHAFHFVGEIVSLFEKGSVMNAIVFPGAPIGNEGLNYLNAVSGYGKASLNLLLPSSEKLLEPVSIVGIVTIVFGFLFNTVIRGKFLLVGAFFLVTLFLTTANITHIGHKLYELLFYIPGFSMFRNFYTQWLYSFVFFYSLLLGLASFNILSKFSRRSSRLFIVIMTLIAVVSSLPLLSGRFVNAATIRGSQSVRAVTDIDPRYEKTLQFIRTLPDDGKILVLPLTDFFRQLVAGTNGGVYEGPSTILHLTSKYSFVGYQDLGYQLSDPAPYAEKIMKYSREKDYASLLQILATLNIRYILHNADPAIYEEQLFPGGDYSYMRTSMPKTQKEYKDFIYHFPVHVRYQNGPYTIYEIDKLAYNPTIFIPWGVYESNTLSFDSSKIYSVFFDKTICQDDNFRRICTRGYMPNTAKLQFRMINAATYEINVSNYDSTRPLLLVLQHTFNNGWKLISGNKRIAERTHVPVNGYANGWLVESKELPQKPDFTLFIMLGPQKYFWYGAIITVISLIIMLTAVAVPIVNSFRRGS